MRSESNQLIEQYQHYFKRIRNTQYWIVVVDNHFFNKYFFFLYERKIHTKLVKSHELLALKHDKNLYQQVLSDLKSVSNLRMEFRDTHHLIEPSPEITVDKIHGHHFTN